jgi:3-deoxy-D-manno-octulosonic acid (KDO) 8-phosphate synthase
MFSCFRSSLAAVGEQNKPVPLKRAWGATLKERLLAAEYVMLQGNRNVILCERGIRSYETYVRNTLALAVVPEIKRLSRLPIIVDPSHGTRTPCCPDERRRHCLRRRRAYHRSAQESTGGVDRRCSSAGL